MTSRDDTDARPVIRDRRRIDPVTGKVREPAGADREQTATGRAAGAAQPPRHAATGDDPVAAATARLAERTADLQRVQAEYANYRKRVERDRVAVGEQALANVLAKLLPVLDNIDRAREHGELSGGFKSVAESIESAVTKLGLVRYGDPGEPFDPNIHDALMHSFSAEVGEPICEKILQPGYKVADRILRPARVAVAGPAGEQQEGQPEGAGAAASQPRSARLPSEPGGSIGEPGSGQMGDETGEEREPAPDEPDTPQDRGG